MSYAPEIGYIVKVGRIMKGMSAAQLAKKCRVSRAYISQLELGHKDPTSKMLIKICKALGCSVDGLWHIHSTARMVFNPIGKDVR